MSGLTIRERIREHAEDQPDGFKMIADSFGIVSDVVEELHARQSVPNVAADSLQGHTGGIVDVFGKLVDRLPDALSVAEVCLVLDRLDVALRGHEMNSCSVEDGAGNAVLRTTVQASVASDAADTRAGVASTPVPAPARDVAEEVAS
ncbi:hypothetical protein ACFVWL_10230 [Microbacterium sp. NPDC058269]|uniref:hypothetical protein n=1 Tax=Microbacterium sp. NPDC058269 TaxID=3346414 RepID=UPI0036D93AAE